MPLTMEAVITRENLMLAYQRVVENKGTAGVDNLSVAELKPWLKKHWRSVRQALIDGKCRCSRGQYAGWISQSRMAA
ncbi:hypothetical protein PL329_23000 [Escherichia coli]|uniref:hypothetical protein n=1 Tax=Escherichia coli TaxID=562 RepID=UPI0023082E2B|nr:hypothetical protein [Escherichia coli]WCE53735.1 hypothetical protein PL329_23000 [Escherichia coli]